MKFIKQLFCKHKNADWVRKYQTEAERSPTYTISWRYDLFETRKCLDCGKIFDVCVGRK